MKFTRCRYQLLLPSGWLLGEYATHAAAVKAVGALLARVPQVVLFDRETRQTIPYPTESA